MPERSAFGHMAAHADLSPGAAAQTSAVVVAFDRISEESPHDHM